MSKKLNRRYEDNTKKIEEILKHKRDLRINYGDRGSKLIPEAFMLVKRQMDCLMESDSVKVTNDDKKVVLRTLNLMTDVLLTNAVTGFVRDLSIQIARLFFNWGKDACKCSNTMRKSQIITRLLQQNMSIVDSIDVMRQVIVKMRRELAYRPPSMEASRHYLEATKGENDEGIDTELM